MEKRLRFFVREIKNSLIFFDYALRRYLEYFFKEGDSMSGLQIFQNAEFGSVRSITVNGEPDKIMIQKSEIATLENPNRGWNVIKRRRFNHDLLKADGILPTMEREV
jgi:hypothetical protein